MTTPTRQPPWWELPTVVVDQAQARPRPPAGVGIQPLPTRDYAAQQRDEWNRRFGALRPAPPPVVIEDSVLPFEPMMVPPEAWHPDATLMRVTVPRPFRPRALFIPASTAEDFDIDGGLHVGLLRIYIGAGLHPRSRIPASIFGWTCGHDECLGIARDARGNLIDTDPLHAEALMENCMKTNRDPRARVLRDFTCDTLEPGMVVSLLVHNISNSAKRFRAVLVGTSWQQ